MQICRHFNTETHEFSPWNLEVKKKFHPEANERTHIFPYFSAFIGADLVAVPADAGHAHLGHASLPLPSAAGGLGRGRAHRDERRGRRRRGPAQPGVLRGRLHLRTRKVRGCGQGEV